MGKNKKTSQLAATLGVNIVLLVGSVVAVNQYITSSKNEIIAYKYKVALPKNTKISKENLEAVKISANAVNKTVITDPDKIVGKYTAAEIYEGELADERKVVAEGQVDPLKSISDEEKGKMRKISIPVDLISTWGGSLGKGDRVDLSFTGKVGEATYTKIFMQNVLVYDVLSSAGESYIKPEDRPPIEVDIKKDAQAAQEIISAEVARRSDLVMAILAVTTEQYEEIKNRLATGEVSLVGRFNGSENVSTKGYADEQVSSPSSQGVYKVENKNTVLIENDTDGTLSEGW